MTLVLTKLSEFGKNVLYNCELLTFTLEQHYNTKIYVDKFSQEKTSKVPTIIDKYLPPAGYSSYREVCLYGRGIQKPMLYAISLVYSNNMSADFNSELINSNVPIGKLIKHFAYKTSRIVHQIEVLYNEQISVYLDIAPTDLLVVKCSTISSNNRPLFFVCEFFDFNRLV